jgi:hypothetical protein
MKLLGLNFAIPSAVQSGFVAAFAIHYACAADLYEGRFWRSRRRGAIMSGRFLPRKLVGSGKHSKRFFAGVQYRPLMPLPALFAQEGRVAHQ